MAIKLASVKEFLHEKSSIGFYSNSSFDTALYKYAYSGFVLQPVIMKPGLADTILSIVDKRRPALSTNGFTTIVKTEDSNFIYSLIKKDK